MGIFKYFPAWCKCIALVRRWNPVAVEILILICDSNDRCLLKRNIARCPFFLIWTEMASEGSSLVSDVNASDHRIGDDAEKTQLDFDDIAPAKSLVPASTDDGIEEVTEEAKTLPKVPPFPVITDNGIEEVGDKAKSPVTVPAPATPISVASPATPPSLKK